MPSLEARLQKLEAAMVERRAAAVKALSAWIKYNASAAEQKAWNRYVFHRTGSSPEKMQAHGYTRAQADEIMAFVGALTPEDLPLAEQLFERIPQDILQRLEDSKCGK